MTYEGLGEMVKDDSVDMWARKLMFTPMRRHAHTQDWNLLLCFIRYSEYSLVHQVSYCQAICSQNLL